MIPVPPRILFAREPVDFRKQIDGLAAACEGQLGEEPLDGTEGNALKGLVWTHGGFTLVYTWCTTTSSWGREWPIKTSR